MTTPSLTLDQVRHFRLERTGLIRPFASPEAAARALFGIQAQILPAAGLALWNRTEKLTHARFEELLYRRRSLVQLWGQRNTLHVYDVHDWPLLHGARAINRTWWERMAADEGNDLEDYRHHVITVAQALRERDSMGRSDLRALNLNLPEELYSSWGGIFADLVRHGYACHAGRQGNEGHFAHRERWAPELEWKPPDAESANTEIALRYFACYGPARAEDLAYWRGSTLGEARRWTAALGDSLAPVLVDGTTHLARREDLDNLLAQPNRSDNLPVRLLYRFDPCLLAHADRRWIVDDAVLDRVSVTAGHINGVVLHRGRAVATWRYDRKGKGIVVTVSPFKTLPRAVTDRLVRLSEGVARFFVVPLADVITEPA